MCCPQRLARAQPEAQSEGSELDARDRPERVAALVAHPNAVRSALVTGVLALDDEEQSAVEITAGAEHRSVGVKEAARRMAERTRGGATGRGR